MKKTYSASLEKRALRAITTNGLLGQKLLAMVHAEHFRDEVTREGYARIKRILETRGRVLEWNDLIHDPSLSDFARRSLAAHTDRVRLNEERIKSLHDHLETYRQHRALVELYNNMGNLLEDDDFRVEDATRTLVEKFGNLRTISGGVKVTTIGLGDNAATMVKLLIKGEQVNYIPTGFSTFDSINVGIPLGSFMMVAATTGGGKCLKGDTLLATNEGSIEIKSIWDRAAAAPIDEQGFKAVPPGLTVTTHTGETKAVTHAYKKRSPTMRITFEDGNTVEGAPEHRIWILINGVPEFKRLDEIVEGDTTPDFTGAHR